jgi:hypothetical protein
MDVMLKPHVESLDGTWRAEIAPTNPDLWFQNYKAMMLQYAQLAQETGVAMLCIGTEMKSMSGQTHKAKWVDLIGAVKQVYQGRPDRRRRLCAADREQQPVRAGARRRLDEAARLGLDS